MSDSTFGFLLMVPALLVLLVVIAFPILKGIYASFCDYGLKELRKGIFDLKWNNFANYKIMLQNNQIFHRLLRNDRDRAAGCGSRELRTVPL